MVSVDTERHTRFIGGCGGTWPSAGGRWIGHRAVPRHREADAPGVRGAEQRYADIIVPQGGHNAVAIDMLLTLIEPDRETVARRTRSTKGAFRLCGTRVFALHTAGIVQTHY